MKRLLNLLSILILGTAVAQEPDWQWVKRGGGTGTWNPSSGGADDQAAGVVTDKFGNTTVCGHFFFSGSTNIEGQLVEKYGQIDGFIAQFDCNGLLRWKFTFGSVDYDMATGITIDTLGNVYVTGYVGTGSQITDSVYFADTTFKFKGSHAFISKIDTSGNLKWLHIAFVGNTGNTYSRAIAIDCNDERVNMLLYSSSGNFNEYAPGVTVSHGYLVASYSLDGALLNVFKAYDYSPDLYFYSVSLQTNGDSYLAGEITDSISIGGTVYDPLSPIGESIVLRFDLVGNHIWGLMSETSGSAGSSSASELYLIPDYHNSFYLVGGGRSSTKFGNKSLNSTSSSFSGYLLKCTSGLTNWINPINNTTAFSMMYRLDADKTENIYVSGIILGSGIIAGDTITSMGNQDPFIAKFDKNGNGIYAKTIPCDGDYQDLPFGIAAGYNGNVFIAGTFEKKIELSVDSVYSQGGNTDFFLAKFGIEQCTDTTKPDTTNVVAYGPVKQRELRVFPNPTNGRFFVEAPNSDRAEIFIYNTLGGMVHRVTIRGYGPVEVMLPESLNDGIYLLRHLSEDSEATARIVIRRD